MAGLDHTVNQADESARLPDDARSEVRNARVGLAFFTVYLVIYCGYVGLAAFARSVMAMTPVAGLNVATLYGLGLIVLALIFAVGYGWACQWPLSNDEMGQAARSGDSTSRPASGRDA